MRAVGRWAAGGARAPLAVAIALASASASAAPGLGVMIDLGLPDGLTAAARGDLAIGEGAIAAHIGVGHNGSGFGVRAGILYEPPGEVLTPYVAIDGGIFPEVDTPGWLRTAAGGAGLDDKELLRVGYRFAGGHLGVRIGEGIALYLQGGVDLVAARALVLKPKPDHVPPVDLYRETSVALWIVGGRVGLLVPF